MNRRKFLNRSLYSAMAAGGLFSAGGMLQVAKAAALQNSSIRGTGYKALVCVFMDGGNDSANMVVPRGASEHAAYAQVRVIWPCRVVICYRFHQRTTVAEVGACILN